MSAKKTTTAADDAIKDPRDWTTGDEPMTGAQDSYVHTLARKAGEEVADDLTKAEASMKIEEVAGEDGRRPRQGEAEIGPISLPERREGLSIACPSRNLQGSRPAEHCVGRGWPRPA